jgi:hypothetical protein
MRSPDTDQTANQETRHKPSVQINSSLCRVCWNQIKKDKEIKGKNLSRWKNKIYAEASNQEIDAQKPGNRLTEKPAVWK